MTKLVDTSKLAKKSRVEVWFEDVEMWYEGTVLSLNRDERSFFIHFDADGEESSFFYAGKDKVKWRYLNSNFLKKMRQEDEKEYVPDDDDSDD